MIRQICFLFFLLAIVAVASADTIDTVVINSADWRDVYSGIAYANFEDIPFYFLISEGQANTVLLLIEKNKSVFLIESEKIPIIKGYKNLLEKEGIEVKEFISKDGKETNLELAKKLTTKKFILINELYPADGISVLPYARITDSYMLFADKNNINSIYSFFKDREIEKLIIYGFVDEEVSEKLKEFKVEEINFEDKFENNIEMVKRYRGLSPTAQVSLVSGELIERVLAEGKEPILFIGIQTTPRSVPEYIKGSGISVGVLVGNELIEQARRLKYLLRDEYKYNFSIFVRFAQGVVSGGGGTPREISSLDYFYLPTYKPNITIQSVEYNTAGNKLEVVYENKGKIRGFFTSSISILIGGERVASVGEETPKMIREGEILSQTYEVDLSEYDIKNLFASIYLSYGESQKLLEYKERVEFPVPVIHEKDESAIDISSLIYDNATYQLTLSIINIGPTPVYVKPSVILNIRGREREFKAEKELLKLGETKNVVYEYVELSEEDLKKPAKVIIQYGKRSNFLLKTLEKNVSIGKRGEMSISKFFEENILFIGLFVILIIIIIIIYIILRKRREKEERVKNGYNKE